MHMVNIQRILDWGMYITFSSLFSRWSGGGGVSRGKGVDWEG